MCYDGFYQGYLDSLSRHHWFLYKFVLEIKRKTAGLFLRCAGEIGNMENTVILAGQDHIW